MTGRMPLVVRPRRIALYGALSALTILATVTAVVVLIEVVPEGQTFRTADFVGFFSVGVFGAAAVMLVARPRLVADADGMAVRNVLGDTYFPWETVERIAFQPGAHWAQVVLAEGETHPLMAIQAMDKQRAVEALRSLRALYEEYRPLRPEPTEEELARQRRRRQAEAAAAAARPLGRLEQIDREKAAAPPRRARRSRR